MENLLPIFQEYLQTVHLIMIPVLIAIGAAVKYGTSIRNNFIPFILFFIAFVSMLAKEEILNRMTIVQSFEQAVIVTFIAIGTYSMFKNGLELRG